MKHEFDRLAFLERRDGEPTAKDWAQRTLNLYRTALKTPYGRAYRRSLVESCLDFREYLRHQDEFKLMPFKYTHNGREWEASSIETAVLFSSLAKPCSTDCTTTTPRTSVKTDRSSSARTPDSRP